MQTNVNRRKKPRLQKGTNKWKIKMERGEPFKRVPNLLQRLSHARRNVRIRDVFVLKQMPKKQTGFDLVLKQNKSDLVREGFKQKQTKFHGIFHGGVPLPPPPPSRGK